MIMAGILKKLFKSSSRHSTKASNNDTGCEYRESKRSKRKSTRFADDFAAQSSTLAYHTEVQPRSYRATRSYAAGDFSEDDLENGCDIWNKSLDMRRSKDEQMLCRHGFSQSSKRKQITSEYGSENPSPTDLLYDPRLDDSEAEHIALEREQHRRRIFELEQRHYEDRGKLKEYKERFKLERELRSEIEAEYMAYREALKKKIKKEEKERKELMQAINTLQEKVNFLEQRQRYSGITSFMQTPILESIVGAGESLCTMSASSVPTQSPFMNPIHNSCCDDVDETKNFRTPTMADYDSEIPRSSASSSTTFVNETRDMTFLRDDRQNVLALMAEISPNRRVFSDSDLFKIARRYDLPATTD